MTWVDWQGQRWPCDPDLRHFETQRSSGEASNQAGWAAREDGKVNDLYDLLRVLYMWFFRKITLTMFDPYWNSFRKSGISFSAVVIGPQMFSKFLSSLNMQDHRRSGDCSGVNRTHQCRVTTSGSRFAYSMDDFDFSESWKSKLARHVVLWLHHVPSFLKGLCECGDCSSLFKIIDPPGVVVRPG